MQIDYFKEFLILAKYLNYSIAAEKLFITQPVLSRHIKALEDYLNTQLFDRSTQSVKLTEDGAYLFDEIQGIIHNYDKVVSKIRVKDADSNISIVIGVPYYAIKDYLRSVPGYIEKTYPHIDMNFITGDPYELINYVLNGKADIIVIPNIPFAGSKLLNFVDLYEERIGILCNKCDPIALNKRLSITEIQNIKILSVNNNYFETMWDMITKICESYGFHPPTPKLLNQMEAVLISIDRASGISINGSHMQNVPMNNIIFIPFSNNECSRRISLCYKNDNKNPAIGTIKQAFKHIYDI